MGNILGNGINQSDLVDLLALIRTNMIGIQTKLDADTGVTDTNYTAGATTALAAVPSGLQTTGVKCIHNQGVVVSMLQDFITKWNATLTKLDNDALVNNTNYNSLWAITDVVGDSKVDPVLDYGIYQSGLVRLLNNIIASIAGVNAKLDADAGVTGTNYAALWNVTDTVIEAGTYQRMVKAALIFAFGLFTLFAPIMAEAISGTVIDNPCQPLGFTYDIDAEDYLRFSMQANYSTATPTAHAIVSAGVDVTNNTLARAAGATHNFATGLRVLYSSTTVTTGFGGLSAGTTYFVIKNSDINYKLAVSSTLAAAGTAIDITSAAAGQTFTLTPLVFSATPPTGFKWQVSNDRVNFTDLPTVSFSSVTFTGTRGSSVWDFGNFNYRYLRISAVQPTAGCIDYEFWINGLDNQ